MLLQERSARPSWQVAVPQARIVNSRIRPGWMKNLSRLQRRPSILIMLEARPPPRLFSSYPSPTSCFNLHHPVANLAEAQCDRQGGCLALDTSTRIMFSAEGLFFPSSRRTADATMSNSQNLEPQSPQRNSALSLFQGLYPLRLRSPLRVSR